MPEPSPNYLKAAFQWQYNIIVLGGAIAAAIVSADMAPLILAAGAELMYLATVPNMARFQRLVRARQFEKKKAEMEAAMKQMLYTLPPERRDRYQQLMQICFSIRENLKRLSANSQMFTGELEGRLEGLMNSFVRLANHDVQHMQYLQITNPDSIKREMSSLAARLPKESPRVQEVNRKRIEILEKRIEKYGKIAENRQVIDAQCRAIEDVLLLIREQSMTMADPQQMSERLDMLVKDVESTEDTVREMESVFQMSPEVESLSDGSGGGTNGRDRMRN
jgi:hypothetical protein